MCNAGRFTEHEIEQLRQIGWEFMPYGPNEWGWRKFDGDNLIAQEGDKTWADDLARLS